MTSTLTFTLPQEQEEFKQASAGAAAFGALHEMAAELRRLSKYTELGSEAATVIQDLRTFFFGVVSDLPEDF